MIWKGKGLEEEGINPLTGEVYIKIDPYYFRPTEVDLLIGDATKAAVELNWKPKYTFEDLVEDMVNFELSLFNI